MKTIPKEVKSTVSIKPKGKKFKGTAKINLGAVKDLFDSLYITLPIEQKERFDKELLKLDSLNVFDEREFSRFLLANGFKAKDSATVLKVDTQTINQYNSARVELGDYDNRKDPLGNYYHPSTNVAPAWTITNLRLNPKYASHKVTPLQIAQLMVKHPMLKHYKEQIQDLIESDV